MTTSWWSVKVLDTDVNLKLVVGAAALATFVVIPAIECVRGFRFLQTLPTSAARQSRIFRVMFSPFVRAGVFPSRVLWYAARYALIAPTLLVARVLGFSQTDLLCRMMPRIVAAHHQETVDELQKALVRAPAAVGSGRLLWAVTFMKSGTNWIMFMCAAILYRGNVDAFLQGDHLHARIPWPEAAKLMPGGSVALDAALAVPTSPDAAANTVIVKTHLPFADVPYSDADKYVVVLRDPKDVVPSAYHFIAGVAMGPAMLPLDAVAHAMANGCMMQEPWAEHADQAWRARNRHNVLLLFYEDMVADHKTTVVRLAQFMGVTLTDAELARVLDVTSFRWMKEQHLFFEAGRATTMGYGSEMIRSGKASRGAELSAEQCDIIDAGICKQLATLGSAFPYNERYGQNN
jgi:hypothetical protein